jgi:hypothetical protein
MEALFADPNGGCTADLFSGVAGTQMMKSVASAAGALPDRLRPGSPQRIAFQAVGTVPVTAIIRVIGINKMPYLLLDWREGHVC